MVYKKRLKSLILVYLAGAVVVAINALFQIFLGFGFCPMALIFGIPCPGCGMSRAIAAAFRLDFETAFFMHPLFLFICVSLVVFSLMYLKTGFKAMENKKILFIYGAILIAVYIARMVIYYPGAEPMEFNEKSILGLILKWING